MTRKPPRSANEISFSPSSFAIYKRCPHIFNISVLHRIRGAEDKRNAAPGLVLHSLMEDCFQIKTKDDHIAYDRLESVFDKVIREERILFQNEVERETCKNDVRSMISTTFDLIEKHNLWPYGEHDTVEERFDEYFDKDLLLKGRSDLCLIRGGAVAGVDDRFMLVLDMKTTKYPQRTDKDQLYIYALALSQKRGIPVRKVGYIFPRLKKVELPELEPKHMTNVLMDLNLAAENIRKGVMPYTPSSESCRFCFKKDSCPVAYNSHILERAHKKLFQEINPGELLW